MPKFRKKPVVIEARQNRLGEYFGDWPDVEINYPGSMGRAKIATLEGVMVAEVGDWIIKGVKGENYPCKPDIFEQTYEAVDG